MSRIGDIVEMRIAKGTVYAQVTHKRPPYGTLVRVIQGVFSERPTDLQALANGDQLFLIFAPIDALCKRGLGKIVGRASIPVVASPFPLFKVPFYLDRSGVQKRWWLWDGLREWQIDTLTPEQRRLPTRTVVTPTELIHRIETGWSPERDV